MKNVVMWINGVDMSEKLLRPGAWSLNKRWSAESFSFTVLNYIFGPEAYRVPIGAEVILYYRTDLMFGGQVQSIEEYRADDEGPIFVDVNCIGYDLLAHQVLITGEIAEGTLLTDAVYALWEKYLAPKNCVWLAPVIQSEPLPKITYIRTSLGELFNRITKLSNWPWRINGERWFAMLPPGSLPIPLNPMRTHHFLAGVKIKQDYHEYGLRLIMQTGGTGEARHNETHTADGLKNHFMTNVEVRPDEIETKDDVETTKTFVPTSFKLNGVDTPFNDNPWAWDKNEHAAWTKGTPPAAGSTLRFEFDIAFPAVVRIWKPELLLPDGRMNPAIRIDKLLDVSFLTDVAETAAWGRVEIDRAGRTPRKVFGSTMQRGHYPYLAGRLSLPEHNVDGTFLLENVTISDSEADPNIFEHLIYDLEFIEGDRAGRHWEDLFTESSGRGGQAGSISITGTGGSVGSPGSGEGGGGTVVAGLPNGFTFQLGGDNNEYVQLTDQWRDIPEMYLTKFGGSGMTGFWNFKAFAYLIGDPIGGPILEIALFAGLDGQPTTQISIGTIITFGTLMQGPWGTFDQPVTVPSVVSNLVCRCRIAQPGFITNVVIGHCLLYKG